MVGFSPPCKEERDHEKILEGLSSIVQLDGARKLSKVIGLAILITSIILFLYTAVVGWGFKLPDTVECFILFAADGIFVAAMSSWRVILDPENAARKAALVGYNASDKMKKKYADRASKLLILLLLLLPAYSAFLMTYMYYVVEPTGEAIIFSNIGITSAYAFAFALWVLPFFLIFLLVFSGCFYLGDSELRKFMWRVYGWGGRKTRNYKLESVKGKT